MCNHKKLMLTAIDLSRDMMRQNIGGPFGAVIAKDGKVVATGWNKVTSDNDPTAHAEVTAIRNACKQLGTHDLTGYTMYTSCEPCPMCLSAIYWAHLDDIYYANTRYDAAAIGFDDEFLYQEVNLPVDKRNKPTVHLEMAEANAVFAEWHTKTDKTEY
jgi:tRNA(Arg) A34 adenosine deaminase TadA